MPATTPAVAPAGRRRFWLTVLVFALANAAAWAGYVAYDRAERSRPRPLLRVDEFRPGAGVTVAGRPVFSWTFNLDAAPPQAPASQPAAVRPIGSITPDVAGRWEWKDARTLTFTPDADLPRATRFAIAIAPKDLRTTDGFQLDKPFAATVQTQALEVTGVRQVGFEDDRLIVELTFNDDVLPTEALAHIGLATPDGKAVPIALHGEAAGKTVRVKTDPIPAARAGGEQVFVRVSPGLAGRGGPLGMAGAFETVLKIGTHLVATDAYATCPPKGDAYLTLRFNNEVDLEAVRHVLSVEPAVPFRLTQNYDGVRLSGPFQPTSRYAIRIAKPPAGGSDKAFPRPGVLSAFVPDRPSGVWFDHNEGYLGSAGNRTLMAHAVNVPALKVSVTRTYDNNVIAWRNANPGMRWSGTDPYSRPIATRRIEFSREKNKPQDVPISLDVLLPAGAGRDGVYEVTVAADAPDAAPDATYRGSRYYDHGVSRTASAMVTLSDIGLSAKRGRDAVTVWAVSLRTAEPLAGVRVRLYSDKAQLLAQATTGDDGLATLTNIHPAPDENAAVLLADRPAEGGLVDAIPAAATESPDRLADPSPGLTWLDLRSSEVNLADADTAGREYLRTGYEAFVYTDRGVYRPGETVRLRAIVRGPDNVAPPRFPVLWQIRRPDLRNWKSQVVELDADGAAGLDLQLPADLPTGRWSAQVGLSGDTGPAAKFFGSVTFQVEEFMPDRMKVSVSLGGGADGSPSNPDRFRSDGGPLAARVQADYLFGRPAAELPAGLVARIEPATFQPAAWGGWTFGDAANTAEVLGGAKPFGRRAELPAATTDKNGRAVWEIDVAGLIANGEVAAPEGANAPGRRPATPRRPAAGRAGGKSDYAGPWRLSVAASVAENGGRAITAGRQVEVDPSPYYVGVRAGETSARPGVAATFAVALVAPGGAVAAEDGELEATLFREMYNTSLVHVDGRYRYQSTRLLEPSGAPIKVTMVAGKGTIEVTPQTGGSFVLRVRDPRTGAVTSRAFHATDGAWDDNVSRENPEKLEVVLLPAPRAKGGLAPLAQSLKKLDIRGAIAALRPAAPDAGKGEHRFRPGDRAQAVIRSPFAGRLLLSVETDGVVSTRVIEMAASQVSVPIDVTDACRPNAYVTATVVRPIDPNAKWQPHRATGVARLLVDNADRRLNVEVAAPPEVRPANTLSTTLRVTDAAGRPVAGAAVTVAAVDEGICLLTNFKTPDPFAFFTANRALAVRTADLYSQLIPEVVRPDKASTIGGDDGDRGGDGRHTTPVVARRVKPVALFAGVIHTGADGVAKADFAVPEFTGQLRVMAVAYTGGNAPAGFGSADRPVLVRSPVLVQSSWPRFAAPGDRFAVPLTVFNNSPADGPVEITVRIIDPSDDKPGPLGFTGAKERTLTLAPVVVKAGGQATATFDVEAAARVGVGRARLVARMNGETYEESIELPVRPASPVLSDGGFASATPDATAKLTVPGGQVDGTSRYELRVTPWPVFNLPQGLDYLERYPYGCAEQTISTCFPLVYLGDIGERIAPGVFDKERVAAKVQAGITRLIGMQGSGGGLAMWAGSSQSWPWASVYAAHFIVEAQAAGHEVPEDFRNHLLAYVRSLVNASGDGGDLLEAQAYACYVLALAGKPERAAMSRLSEVVQARPVAPEAAHYGRTSARFHLAAAWLAAGRRDLAAGLLPRVLPAPRESRELGGNIGSPIRDRAVLLSTLLAVDPDRPEVPALAQELSDAGRAGKWRSTQDTTFAVLALGRYLRQTKAAAPYATAELWRGDQRLATAGAGETLVWDAASTMPDVQGPRAGANPMPPTGTGLEVRITGPAGAKAFAAWLRTGVPEQPPAAADSGMKVRRRYLDRNGKPLDGGIVHSGDLVRVELSLTSTGPLENVVVEDLLPAGLEIENPRLETTVAAAGANEPVEDAGPGAFEQARLDVRDDRLVIVGRMNAAGEGRYVHTARAVAPGAFTVPPVRAECMYDIGTCSLSGGGGTLKVVPAAAGRVAGAGAE